MNPTCPESRIGQATLNWQWELINPGTYAIRIAHGLLIFSEKLNQGTETVQYSSILSDLLFIFGPTGQMLILYY